jgi:hypothetical protein
MKVAEVSDRVTAVSHTNPEGDKVYFFGHGVYLGDRVPGGDNLVGMAVALREEGVANPVIELDNGEIVYGCECWWGPVEEVEKRFEGMEWVEVSIEAARAEYRESASEEDASVCSALLEWSQEEDDGAELLVVKQETEPASEEQGYDVEEETED